MGILVCFYPLRSHPVSGSFARAWMWRYDFSKSALVPRQGAKVPCHADFGVTTEPVGLAMFWADNIVVLLVAGPGSAPGISRL